MKQSRSQFKLALDNCKNNEEKLRNEKMAHSYKNKRYKDFWQDVKSNKKGQLSTPSTIDGESNPQVVANKFSTKYKEVFDRNNNGISSAEEIDVDLSKPEKNGYYGRISKSSIYDAIKQLKCTIGDDMIHSNHLKYCMLMLWQSCFQVFLSTGIFQKKYCWAL